MIDARPLRSISDAAARRACVISCDGVRRKIRRISRANRTGESSAMRANDAGVCSRFSSSCSSVGNNEAGIMDRSPGARMSREMPMIPVVIPFPIGSFVVRHQSGRRRAYQWSSSLSTIARPVRNTDSSCNAYRSASAGGKISRT